jgi:hypothetical protein
VSLHRRVLLGYVSLVWVLSVGFLLGPRVYNAAEVNTKSLIGGVIGVSAAIPPNEWNSLASALAQKEAELNTRESALSLREQSIAAEVDVMQQSREKRIYGYLFGVTTILFLLVISNFYLDYRRGHAVI